MTTASLELCKELYELSGWDDTYGELSPKGHWWPRGEFLEFHTGSKEKPTPAYDLGFLLRKLEKELTFSISLHNIFQGKKGWTTSYQLGALVEPVVADTPEDAVCKLAIELFKGGILKK